MLWDSFLFVLTDSKVKEQECESNHVNLTKYRVFATAAYCSHYSVRIESNYRVFASASIAHKQTLLKLYKD